MTGPEADARLAGTEAMLRAQMRSAADPAFLRRLRAQARARHARATRNLGWFDVPFGLGPLRVVHDGELVHLVTNDPSHFNDVAGEILGFVPGRGEKERLRRLVETALAGKVRGSEVTFLGDLPAFHRQVLEATARIPRGEVRPYAWVARQAGAPGAVRAAGTALAHNPVPFIVPCHRVVKSDWAVGQYSAGGPEMKERVLKLEGVEIERLVDIRSRRVRFYGNSAAGTFCFPGCEGEWQLSEPNPGFHSAEEALAAGFRPCGICQPA